MPITRIYNQLIETHFAENNQMVFLTGPRQVGKTTTAKNAGDGRHTSYFNWDNVDDRRYILQGPRAIAEKAGFNQLQKTAPLIIFDEIHKFNKWKTFIKGFYDTYGTLCKIIVTGSSRLDTYKKGGDSLMGRYFQYRMHPLSVREILQLPFKGTDIHPEPASIPEKTFADLLHYGGFPEPYINANPRFYNKWMNLREQQLIRDDVRDISNVHEIKQMEVLAEIIKQQAGQLVSLSSFSNKVRVSIDTVRRWVDILSSLYFCFSLRPWSKNITRSLLKEPKLYLWDWSLVSAEGLKCENFLASHLLKAVQLWTDYGLGTYDLYFLRDKEKREVDFLVAKNDAPWFIIEVKKSGQKGISKSLAYFQKITGAEHAFQVAFDMPFVDQNCFLHNEPVIVPASTFVSQLV